MPRATPKFDFSVLRTLRDQHGLTLAVQKLINPDSVPVQGWTSIFVTTSFFGGLTQFLLGLILERLSTMLTRAQGHPAFFIVDRSRDELWSKKA